MTNELKKLRSALMDLHRLFLATLKEEHESKSGDVLNAGAWFQVLVSSPEYGWVKPFNSLVSDMDALLDLKNISEQDLVILRHELDNLFFKESDEVTSFNFHYRKLFARRHDLMFSHGHLKHAVANLPLKALPAHADEIRKGWHKTVATKRTPLN